MTSAGEMLCKWLPQHSAKLGVTSRAKRSRAKGTLEKQDETMHQVLTSETSDMPWKNHGKECHARDASLEKSEKILNHISQNSSHTSILHSVLLGVCCQL